MLRKIAGFRPETYPACPRSIARLPRSRGYVDYIRALDDALHVHGWSLLPEEPFTSFAIYVNGNRLGTVEPHFLEGVKKFFRRIPHAGRSGFQIKIPYDSFERTATGRLDVVSCAGGSEIARLSTLLRADLADLPTPSPEIMVRSARNESADIFRADGLKTFGEFIEAVECAKPFTTIRRMMDWGCGSGRVTMHFMRMDSGPDVHGCDIDAEAIRWCNDNLQNGSFIAVEPWPPTPYRTGEFDLVVSHSVFTHLNQDAQDAWLKELQRIIVPGGLLVASVHGEFAARFSFAKPPTNLGFVDLGPDSILDGIAPRGYYRCSFQGQQYTRREFSRYFEVVEYLERGDGNFQDLVVMRRPGDNEELVV